MPDTQHRKGLVSARRSWQRTSCASLSSNIARDTFTQCGATFRRSRIAISVGALPAHLSIVCNERRLNPIFYKHPKYKVPVKAVNKKNFWVRPPGGHGHDSDLGKSDIFIPASA